MNECIDRDIQEMLPDLLHRTLRSEERERIEFHLATCDSCREELAVLRTVKSAAVFSPAIDVGQIVRQIPPYQRIMPAVEAPARNRVARWLVAATMALLVVGGGSAVLNRQARPGIGSRTVDSVASASPAAVAETALVSAPSRNLTLAADVASLTDGDLVQLMNELESFDALPTSEVEPVIAVDSVDSL